MPKDFNRPNVLRIGQTNDFEIQWVFSDPEKRIVHVSVNGQRQIRGKDYALGIIRGQFILYFKEKICLEELDVEIL